MLHIESSPQSDVNVKVRPTETECSFVPKRRAMRKDVITRSGELYSPCTSEDPLPGVVAEQEVLIPLSDLPRERGKSCTRIERTSPCRGRTISALLSPKVNRKMHATFRTSAMGLRPAVSAGEISRCLSPWSQEFEEARRLTCDSGSLPAHRIASGSSRDSSDHSHDRPMPEAVRRLRGGLSRPSSPRSSARTHGSIITHRSHSSSTRESSPCLRESRCDGTGNGGSSENLRSPSGTPALNVSSAESPDAKKHEPHSRVVNNASCSSAQSQEDRSRRTFAQKDRTSRPRTQHKSRAKTSSSATRTSQSNYQRIAANLNGNTTNATQSGQTEDVLIPDEVFEKCRNWIEAVEQAKADKVLEVVTAPPIEWEY